MNVYVCSEDEVISAGLVGSMRLLGMQVVALSFGMPGRELLHAGAQRVIAMQGQQERPEAYAVALQGLVAEGCPLVLGATASGREIAAYLAVKMKRPLLTDVLSLEFEDGIAHATHASMNGMTELCSPASCVITAATALCLPARVEEASPVCVSECRVDLRVHRAGISARAMTASLAKAESVLAVGAGVADDASFDRCRQLARRLGAEMCCTRSVLERHDWLPPSAMVGITGASICPDFYLACGVSGQPQHMYGLSGVRVVAAIDRNPDSPIFRQCDYGLVADLNHVLPELLEMLAPDDSMA